MERELIEKYKNEMLRMYASANNQNMASQTQNQQETPSQPLENRPQNTEQTQGNLLAVVTTIRTLYPVPNAKVTVFSGDYRDMNVIDTSFTDQSGRTKDFSLPTPEKQLSLESANTVIPYAVYNLLVEADGYVDNIHLNVPVFSGVTSIQSSNLMLKETAGVNMDVQIFDESQKYDL